MELNEKDQGVSPSTNDSSPLNNNRGFGFNSRNDSKDYLHRSNWQGKRFVESKRFINQYSNPKTSHNKYRNSGSSVSDYQELEGKNPKKQNDDDERGFFHANDREINHF